MQPSGQPSSQPTQQPSTPTGQPTSVPSSQPSSQPTVTPTDMPVIPKHYNQTQRYQSLDRATFDSYTAVWRDTHENWIDIQPDVVAGCRSDQPRYFPVCVDGYVIDARDTGMNNLTCDSKVQCIQTDPISLPLANEACLPTRYDTMEYTPPARPEYATNDSHICYVPTDARETLVDSLHYGFGLGVPPYFDPIRPVRLNFTGTVRGQSEQGQCGHKIEGAKIDAWHINPVALQKFTAQTERKEHLNREIVTDLFGSTKLATLYDDWGSVYNQTIAPKQLSDISCRGYTETDSEGHYAFDTMVPPSYGPPRHIMISVEAPGYQPLLTRMYFREDIRLYQLTTLNGKELEIDPESAYLAHGFDIDNLNGNASNPKTYSASQFPGEIGNDPRVIDVLWKDAELGHWQLDPNMPYGHFEAVFDIVLTALRPNVDTDGIAGNRTSTDINGMWVDESGGAIKVETQGNHFHAMQYPHKRTWGSVVGYMTGDTIRGVDFTNPLPVVKSAYALSQEAQGRPSRPSILHPADNFDALVTATGVILHRDARASAPVYETINEELSIIWSSGQSQERHFTWSKNYDKQHIGYRYLKLMITKETYPDVESVGGPAGLLEINEIRFYEGVIGQRELPNHHMKMSGPLTPAPQRVTCSSVRDVLHPCYKAFDGSDQGNSSWMNYPAGSSPDIQSDGTHSGQTLGTPQWILMDFGAGKDILPTALKIVCGASYGDAPRGCPRAFTLLGSRDNKRFDTLYSEDLVDYTDEYSDGGKRFTFYWETSQGRLNGHKCGSCDIGPAFKCAHNGYDMSCASKYCSMGGYCGKLPTCPAGQYLHYSYKSHGHPIVACAYCAAGRYGARTNMYSNYCSGKCQAGYYCPAGSTSPTQRECGGIDVFCPEGSGAPTPASSGRHTVYEVNDTTHGITGLTPIDLTVNGSTYYYRQPNWLSSQEYNNYQTIPSYYYYVLNNDTSEGPHNITVSNVTYAYVDDGGNHLHITTRTYDVLCRYGHYCSKGEQIQCPLGTYGDRLGLQTAKCTDTCVSGEYCPPGSVTPTICEKGYYCPDGKVRVPCPEGTYGKIKGLKDSVCSGKCTPGYYCPRGSFNNTQEQCAAGRFGQISGLKDAHCSGPCEAGYYCPATSTSSRQVPCGGVNGSTPFNVYCPVGSGEPRPVLLGYYSTEGEQSLRQNQTMCEPGFYCYNGLRLSCPRGTYGNESMMFNADLENRSENGSYVTSAVLDGVAPLTIDDTQVTGYACTGLCDPGHYCPFNSSNPTQVECPAGRYGISYGLRDDACTDACPMGHYCPAGSVKPTRCPAGVYGNTTGLTAAHCNAHCSESPCKPNSCQEGYYCPLGSVTAAMRECGNPQFYCPTGSAEPTDVSAGYYSIGPFPYRVDEVHYTIGPFPVDYNRIRTDQAICPVGYFCKAGIKQPCPEGTYGDTTGLMTNTCNGPCPLGHFCPAGTSAPTRHRCPAGRYGGNTGLSLKACSGLCAPGYHCPEGSSSPYELECAVYTPKNRTDYILQQSGTDDIGFTSPFVPLDTMTEEVDFSGASVYPNANMVKRRLVQPNTVFCPEGTLLPVIAFPGYFTIGNNRTTRHDQKPCPMGSYCIDGVIYDCPAGRYGRGERLIDPQCTGPCAKGHYCPPGSTTMHEYPCPIGRYGSIEGLQNSLCSGPCKKALDCPLGSVTEIQLMSEKSSAIF
jgi:protocatechuate 3,4-dioxygenase beta subunit